MILELLTEDGFSLAKRNPAEIHAACPFCGGSDGHSDRLTIWPSKDRFWCRQCLKSGDSITYLRDHRAMTFYEAQAYLAGQPVERRRPEITIKPQPEYKVDQGLWSLASSKLVRTAHAALISSEHRLKWLVEERGITKETAIRHRLGWIRQDQFFNRRDFGLQDTGKKLFAPSGLVIPGGTWIRIRRDNPGKDSRYWTIKGQDLAPLTIGAPHNSTGIIVESDLDAILLAQEIKRPVFVVSLGSATTRPDEHLAGLINQCPVVLACLDNDNAGRVATPWWIKHYWAQPALMPNDLGKDVTEAWRNGLDLNDWLSVAMEMASEAITNPED